jgi:hypothetical protein
MKQFPSVMSSHGVNNITAPALISMPNPRHEHVLIQCNKKKRIQWVIQAAW